MMISILSTSIFAATLSALWFGLTSGSFLVALLAYSLTGVGVTVVTSVVAVIRCEYLCKSAKRAEATKAERSVAA